MAVNPKEFTRGHPLLIDRARLAEIADVVYAVIQKRLFPGRPVRRRSGFGMSRSSDSNQPEFVLHGTGDSADDVLSDTLIDLVRYPESRLKTTWEQLAVKIARNKANDALRRARSGLQGTELRPELHLVSGDFAARGPDSEVGSTVFEVLESDSGDAESEYLETRDALKVRDLAREILDERELAVLLGIHFSGRLRREIGDQLGLSGQRVGQIYKGALRKLKIHPEFQLEFGDSDQGGTDE